MCLWFNGTASEYSEANSVNILINNTASECSEANSVNIFTDVFVTPVVLQKHQLINHLYLAESPAFLL